MTDDSANIVLEHLRRIRASQDRVELELGEMKTRISSIENILGQQQIQLAALNVRMVRFEERLSRIERRLDLVDAK